MTDPATATLALARAEHINHCHPLATVDPVQCVWGHGWQGHLSTAAAILATDWTPAERAALAAAIAPALLDVVDAARAVADWPLRDRLVALRDALIRLEADRD